MRLFGAVVMIAGMVWLMVGLGGVLSPLMGDGVKGGGGERVGSGGFGDTDEAHPER